MLYSNAKSRQKGINNLESFGRLERERAKNEADVLSHIMGELGMEDLAQVETDLAERQNKVLFQIATELEDTEGALRQAEQLVKRFKKRLEQLKDLQRVLSK